MAVIIQANSLNNPKFQQTKLPYFSTSNKLIVHCHAEIINNSAKPPLTIFKWKFDGDSFNNSRLPDFEELLMKNRFTIIVLSLNMNCLRISLLEILLLQVGSEQEA